MTWRTPAYEAAEAAPEQPCTAYATLVPSGDAANSLTASPLTGSPTARRPVTCPVLVTLNWQKRVWAGVEDGHAVIVAAATVKVRSSAVTEMLRPRIQPAGSVAAISASDNPT